MRESYRAIVEEMTSSGRSLKDWIFLPFPCIKTENMKLGHRMTFRLAGLMYIQFNDFPNAERDHDGWFPFPAVPTKVLCQITSPASQKHFLSVLQKKGFVDQEKRGKPGVRYIHINFDLVYHYFLLEVERLRQLHDDFFNGDPDKGDKYTEDDDE